MDMAQLVSAHVLIISWFFHVSQLMLCSISLGFMGFDSRVLWVQTEVKWLKGFWPSFSPLATISTPLVAVRAPYHALTSYLLFVWLCSFKETHMQRISWTKSIWKRKKYKLFLCLQCYMKVLLHCWLFQTAQKAEINQTITTPLTAWLVHSAKASFISHHNTIPLGIPAFSWFFSFHLFNGAFTVHSFLFS